MNRRVVHNWTILAMVLWCIVAPEYLLPSPGAAKTQATGTRKLSSSSRGSNLLNINKLSMWLSNDGTMERDMGTSTAGVTFPRDSTTVVNIGGFVWGGIVRSANSQIRVGGSTLKTGLQPGRIIRPGIAQQSDDPAVRLYRIRRDWATADLARDASEYFNLPILDVDAQIIEELRSLYKQDWIEWPWQDGAPYYERNGIPGYQPDSTGVVDSTSDEPGLGSADQVVWCVANDLSSTTTQALYGSSPIGIEMQLTCWAYNRIPNLKNVIFQRCRIIYKGTSQTPGTSIIDSMYLAKWVDPDIGNFNDDFVGYDKERTLAYAYNATPADIEFSKFNIAPAVVGYTLLQGPRIPVSGGTAQWNLTTIEGYSNLEPSAFTYFTTADDRIADFNVGTYGGTTGWYKLMRTTCFQNPVTGRCTQYELDGDAELFQGWVDGIQQSAGDRRFATISGPFSMAIGDTQEVVFGMVAAIGLTNRSGISSIKSISEIAHDVYRHNFEFPDTIPSPTVKITELENQITLDWESDTARTRFVENYSSLGYKFETYVVYQYPSATPKSGEGIIYEIFDPTKPRFLYITEDKLRDQSLVNGQKYYFAVVTRVYSSDPEIMDSRLESTPEIHVIIPHSPNPGTVYSSSIGDTISNLVNINGINDAQVNITVFDPMKADGHNYKVLFHRDVDPWIDFNEKPSWSLVDSTNGDTLVNHLRVDSPEQRIITRGLSVRAMLPRHGLVGIYQVEGDGEKMYNPIFNVPDEKERFMIVATGSSILDTMMGQKWGDHDIEFRFLGDSSWAYRCDPAGFRYTSWARVPYTCWERRIVGIDTVYRQLYTVLLQQGTDTTSWKPADLLNRTYNGKPLKVFKPIFVVSDSIWHNGYYVGNRYYDDAPYRANMTEIRSYLITKAYYNSDKDGLVGVYFADLDDDGIAAPIGTIVRAVFVHEIRDGDAKVFLWKKNEYHDLSAAGREIEKINVFPNPYYGMNRAEISQFQKFVTFNHLPQYATIRIFNLAGVLVKTIQKTDEGQFAQWDLNNETGLQVAGGLYIAHLQLRMPDGDQGIRDLGEKILKLMIVPANKSIQNN
jgi:hypothetical protein